MWYSYKPYVSVAQRRANAAREMKKTGEEGRKSGAGPDRAADRENILGKGMVRQS